MLQRPTRHRLIQGNQTKQCVKNTKAKKKTEGLQQRGEAWDAQHRASKTVTLFIAGTPISIDTVAGEKALAVLYERGDAPGQRRHMLTIGGKLSPSCIILPDDMVNGLIISEMLKRKREDEGARR